MAVVTIGRKYASHYVQQFSFLVPAGSKREKNLCWSVNDQGMTCNGGAFHLGPHMCRKDGKSIWWANERIRTWQ